VGRGPERGVVAGNGARGTRAGQSSSAHAFGI